MYARHLQTLGATVTSASIRSRVTRPRGGPKNRRRLKRSFTTTRASRCPIHFRGRPSAPIATTARTGSSSTGWAGRRTEPSARYQPSAPRPGARFRVCASTRPSIAAVGRRDWWPGRMRFRLVCAPAIAFSKSTASRCSREGILPNSMDSGRSACPCSRDRAQRRAPLFDGTFNPTRSTCRPLRFFHSEEPSGRVDVVSRGNVVEVSTEGVRRSRCCCRRQCSISGSL